MSRGFGKVQQKVIAYLEENIEACPEDITKATPEHKRSSIRRAIKTLIDKGVIIQGKMKSLKTIFDPHYKMVYPKPKRWRINKEHPKYKEYKRKQFTLNDL